MLTALLQLLSSLTSLALGALAWLRAGEPLNSFRRPVQAAAWRVTAVAFLVLGASGVAHGALAVWAVAEGPESWAWKVAVRLLPVGNDGRLAVGVALGVVLLLVASGRRWRVWCHRAVAPSVMLLAYAAGALTGWAEGPLRGRGGAHFATVAMVSAVELAVLLAALLLGLLRRALPRHLWWCLAIYALNISLSVGGFSAMAWVDVAGAWTPSPSMIQLQGWVLHLLMLGLLVQERVRVEAAAPEPVRRTGSGPLPQPNE